MCMYMYMYMYLSWKSYTKNLILLGQANFLLRGKVTVSLWRFVWQMDYWTSFCMLLFQLDSEDSTEMSSFCSRLLAILHGKGGWSWEWPGESRERGHLGGKTIGELVMCSLGVFKRTRFGVTDLPRFQCTSYLFHVLSKSCPAMVRTCFSFKRPMGRMDL